MEFAGHRSGKGLLSIILERVISPESKFQSQSSVLLADKASRKRSSLWELLKDYFEWVVHVLREACVAGMPLLQMALIAVLASIS